MKIKDVIFILALALLAWLLPLVTLFYLICGLLDFRRSHRFEIANWRRYFYGNGVLTWVLSPVNLLMDLFCYRNLGIYQLSQLPEDCQEEIRHMMAAAESKPELITELSRRMEEKRRGMIFFKWYGKNVNTSLSIPEFHRSFRYIKTIGVSIFNKNQRTSTHYGPLRVTLRVLYNLVPLQNDGVYIQVAKHKHLWHENPLFIFDDTLVHQSVNRSDHLRYCMFVDILRPSYARFLINGMLNAVRLTMISLNSIFYKNWDMIK